MGKVNPDSNKKDQSLPITKVIAEPSSTSVEVRANPPPQSPPQRIQPDGGYLQTGNPGNKGGPGRRPERIREKLQVILESKLLPWIEDTATRGETETCPICGAVPNPKLLRELTKIALDAAVPKQQEVEVSGSSVLLLDVVTPRDT